VAVSGNNVDLVNEVMTSPDGDVWTGRATNSGGYFWKSVAWSSSLSVFIAIAVDTDIVLQSTDGVTWVTAPTLNNTPNDWVAITWAPEPALFMAVNTGGLTMTTSDAIHWEVQTNVPPLLYSLCWAPQLSLFVSGSASRLGTLQAGNASLTAVGGVDCLSINNIGVTSAAPFFGLAQDTYIITANSEAQQSGTVVVVANWNAPTTNVGAVSRVNGVFTLLTHGTYMVSVYVEFDSNGTGYRKLSIADGVGWYFAAATVPSVSGTAVSVNVTGVLTVLGSQSFQIECEQNSGSDLNRNSARLMCARLF
jgi:hypothetical protein